jgi:hypothetical protein
LHQNTEEGLHSDIDLGFDWRHLQFNRDLPQLLDGTRAADATVSYKANRLSSPCHERGIQRVLEDSGGAVIVLSGRRNVGVESADEVRTKPLPPVNPGERDSFMNGRS